MSTASSQIFQPDSFTRKLLDDPSTVIPQAAKAEMRIALLALQSDAYKRRVKLEMAALDSRLVDVLERVRLLESQGVQCSVLSLELGTDAKVLKRTVDEVQKVRFDCLLVTVQ